MKHNIVVINVAQKVESFFDLWSPKIVAHVNDSYVKLAKFKGEYVWHQHDNEDEMFLVISGVLKIELQDKILVIQPGEMVVIPKGVQHKPVADDEVSVMLIESTTTVSTGDAVDTKNKKSTHGEWI